MSNFAAVYDACVLYPAPLRDLLVELAASGTFRAKWTEKIHDEWIRNLLNHRRDLDKKRLENTKKLMNESVMDCLVSDYEDLESGIMLPDNDDRHVVAAAIKGRAEVIVTFNLKDFPRQELSKYDIEAQHPDEFISHLIDLHPGTVCAAAKACRMRLKSPPKSVEEYIDILSRQQLPNTAAYLREMKNVI